MIQQIFAAEGDFYRIILRVEQTEITTPNLGVK